MPLKKVSLMILVILMMVLVMNLGTVSTFASMSDEARPISVNSAVTDNLPTSDTVRYYKVELPTPGKVNLSFNHSNLEKSYVYWKVTMFDSVENQVLYFESTGTNTAGKSMNAYLGKGTFYVRVTYEGYWHSNIDYNLTVNHTENLGEFEIEQNNDREQATVISEMNKPITGNLRLDTDIDFYKFTMQNSGKVNLSFNHGNLEKSYVYWKITMFDSVENEVLYFESTGTDTTGKSMNAYLDKGTYYIRVTYEGYWHNNADYNLTVNYTENPGGYEVEQNNSIEQATVISEVNKPITGNLREKTDVDYYKFTMQNTGKVYLGFNHGNLEKSNIYWKVTLFDSNNKDLLKIDSKGTDTIAKSNEITIGKGTYYVRVAYEGYWHNNADYTLTINASGSTATNNSQIRVLLNGTQIQFDQPPIIQNGRTLVPLRAIFEAMGATVSWNEKSQTVTAVKGNTTVVMIIGNKTMTKNGAKITLDVPPQILNGRTLVPARAVAESFGAKVDWDGNTQTVKITQ